MSNEIQKQSFKNIVVLFSSIIIFSICLFTSCGIANQKYFSKALNSQGNKQTHGNRGKKYTTVFISKQSNKTISINETGNYYLKTKAVISGKAPVYKKGDPFKVYVGRDGYSVLTITFSIRESSLPNLLSGKQISKSDFDNDSD